MDGMEGPIDMAINKALLDQLLAGREPQELFAKNGLIDELKKALSERMNRPGFAVTIRGAPPSFLDEASVICSYGRS